MSQPRPPTRPAERPRRTANSQQATPPRNRAQQPSNRAQQRRRSVRRARRPWWRGPAPLVGIVIVVIAIIIAFIVISNQNNSDASIGKPASATIVNKVTGVSPSVIAAVGTGGLTNPIRAISSTRLSKDGKPELLYVGAEFCPHCAADRWSLVNALSRFGTFSNLHYMRSASTDMNLATFTFKGSSYTSKYFSFTPVEYEDRSGNQLEPLNNQQSQLFSTLGGSGFPFLDFAGQYANDAPHAYSGGYDPSILSGLDWSQIADKLTNANDPVTQAIVGNANYLTAAVCAITHNQPASACGVSAVKSILQQAPYNH